MAEKTFRFVAGRDPGTERLAAICLEHDLVVQGDEGGSLEALKVICEEHMQVVYIVDCSEGIESWKRSPPPVEAVSEIRELAESAEFNVVLDEDKLKTLCL